MPIKQIRKFAELVQKGDSTISKRKQLFYKQREAVEKQIAELKANLAVLDYKCRYYTEAEKTGSTEALFQISKKDYPKNPRSIHKKFKNDRL